MKKTYMAPALRSVDLISESVMASVSVIPGEKIENPDQFLSDKKEGYHPIWGNMDEE